MRVSCELNEFASKREEGIAKATGCKCAGSGLQDFTFTFFKSCRGEISIIVI